MVVAILDEFPGSLFAGIPIKFLSDDLFLLKRYWAFASSVLFAGSYPFKIDSFDRAVSRDAPIVCLYTARTELMVYRSL